MARTATAEAMVAAPAVAAGVEATAAVAVAANDLRAAAPGSGPVATCRDGERTFAASAPIVVPLLRVERAEFGEDPLGTDAPARVGPHGHRDRDHLFS